MNKIVKDSDYTLAEGTEQYIREQLQLLVKDEGFGNGRHMRNLFEAAVNNHAWALKDIQDPTGAQLSELTINDFTTN